jgi:hypothetical protein
MKLFKPAWEKDVRWQLSNWRALNPEKSRHYVSVQALRKMQAEIGREAVKRLTAIPPGPGQDPHNVDAMCGEIIDNVRRFDLGKDLAAIGELIRLAENDEYRAIAKEIEPLIESARKFDQAEEKARLDRQRAEGALHAAREAAQRRALENVESDSEVVAARERLERSSIAAGARS